MKVQVYCSQRQPDKMMTGYLQRASTVMLSNKEATFLANLWLGHFGPSTFQKGGLYEDVMMVTS